MYQQHSFHQFLGLEDELYLYTSEILTQILCLTAVCDGQVLTTDNGVITSPDYPQQYSKLADCDWTIEV